MNYEDKVYEFHKAFGHPTAEFPNLPQDTDIRELRMALLDEEFNEYLLAESNNDLTGIADALGDMLYIIFGTAITYGIPIGNVFGEIHRSNMTKLGLDGKPVLADNGKVMKGPLYEKPDIQAVIAAHRFWYLAMLDLNQCRASDAIADRNEYGYFMRVDAETSHTFHCKFKIEPTSITFAKTHAKEITTTPSGDYTAMTITF